jgi:hypothetical protein
MLWMLITPNAVATPQAPRNVAMRSPTVVRGSDMVGLSAGDIERDLLGPEEVLHQAKVRLRRDPAGSGAASGTDAPIIAEMEAAAAQVSAVILP